MELTKRRGALQLFSVLGLVLGLAAALAWYYDSYAVNWQPIAFVLALVAASAGIILLTLLVLRARGEKKRTALAWKITLSMLLFTGVILGGIPAVINNVIGGGKWARQATWIALTLAAAQVLALLYLFLRGTERLGKKAGAALLCACLAVAALLCAWMFVKPAPVIKQLDLTEIYDNSVDEALPQGIVHDIVLEHFGKEREDGKMAKCLVIGFDGCRADALANIDEGKSGILTLKTQGGAVYYTYAGGEPPQEQSTSTGPGWTTILTGHWAEEPGGTGHTVTGNGITKPVEPKLIFTQLLKQNLAKKTTFIVSWGGHFKDSSASYLNEMAYCKEHGLNAAWVTKVSDAGTFRDTLAQVKAADGPDVVMCIQEHCDHTGHSSGFSNQNLDYVKAVRDSDKEALALIEAVQNRASYADEDWLIIITTDHGGDGTSHGSQAAGCRQTFIAWNQAM